MMMGQMIEHKRQPLIVRFSESVSYDINTDGDVMRLMATTGTGSYWAEVVAEVPSEIRKARAIFKDKVIELMQRGVMPCEVMLND